MERKVTYNYFKLLYLLKHWIVFCLLLFFVIKPGITIIAVMVESKYEFYDNLVNENTEEIKEDNSDDEKIRESFYFKTRTFATQSYDHFGGFNHFLNFKPDIHLPPPKLFITSLFIFE